MGNSVPSFLRAKVSRPRPDDLGVAGVFVMIDVTIVLFTVRRGHQHFDIFADDFGGRVAKNCLGRTVKGLDGAAFVNGDDAFHRVSRMARRRFFAVMHGGLGAGQPPRHPTVFCFPSSCYWRNYRDVPLKANANRRVSDTWDLAGRETLGVKRAVRATEVAHGMRWATGRESLEHTVEVAVSDWRADSRTQFRCMRRLGFNSRFLDFSIRTRAT